MTREQEISVQEIIITVRARSFLYNQVRNIVGFLVNQGDRYDARVMKHYDLVGQYVGEVEEVEEVEEGEEGEEETQEDTSSDASVDDILESERAATTLLERMDRDVAPAKAPARGLYLMHVGY
jgi:tRNA U38,U39,U40 pseudouridine synthase TruA